MIEPLQAGRDALNRHAWAEAMEALAAVDQAAGLEPADLEKLAAASWWAGHPDDSARGPLHHRQVKIPDLLIAAVAARNDLTVVHYDSDYEVIASVTGQPTRWAAPRGTV